MPKALLIEDNEMNRDMLARRLARHGYDVITANDGAAGVTLAAEALPDIILMDMGLPVMDGWQAAQKIKGNAATAAIPVLGLSAHAMEGDRDKALSAGCDDYDTKPVEINRLLSKMAALLKAAKPKKNRET